jgi:hypothetical protein
MRTGALILALLLCADCTTVNSYAVLAPHSEVGTNGSCFRQCQLVRAGGTNAYLNCVRTCPGTAVYREGCESIEVPPAYQCTTEHNKSFNAAGTILAIALGVVALFVLAAVTADGNKSQ